MYERKVVYEEILRINDKKYRINFYNNEKENIDCSNNILTRKKLIKLYYSSEDYTDLKSIQCNLNLKYVNEKNQYNIFSKQREIDYDYQNYSSKYISPFKLCDLYSKDKKDKKDLFIIKKFENVELFYNELYNSLFAINKMKKYIPNFCFVHGLLNTYINIEIVYENFLKDSVIKFSQFINKPPKNISDKDFDNICLQIYLSLYTAKIKFDFRHNNLNPDNILITKKNTLIEYIFENKSIKIESNYFVKILNYEYSSISHIEETNEKTMDDINIAIKYQSEYDKQSSSELFDFKYLHDKIKLLKKVPEYFDYFDKLIEKSTTIVGFIDLFLTLKKIKKNKYNNPNKEIKINNFEDNIENLKYILSIEKNYCKFDIDYNKITQNDILKIEEDYSEDDIKYIKGRNKIKNDILKYYKTMLPDIMNDIKNDMDKLDLLEKNIIKLLSNIDYREYSIISNQDIMIEIEEFSNGMLTNSFIYENIEDEIGYFVNIENDEKFLNLVRDFKKGVQILKTNIDILSSNFDLYDKNSYINLKLAIYHNKFRIYDF